MLGAEGRGQRALSLGSERLLPGGGQGVRRSPSVTEGSVLGLEVGGLQEDTEGFLEVTQVIQTLALRRHNCQLCSEFQLC